MLLSDLFPELDLLALLNNGADASGFSGNVNLGSGAVTIAGGGTVFGFSGDASFAFGASGFDSGGALEVGPGAHSFNVDGSASFAFGASGIDIAGNFLGHANSAYLADYASLSQITRVNDFFQSTADFTNCAWNGDPVPLANAASFGASVSGFFGFAADFTGCDWNGNEVPTAAVAGSAAIASTAANVGVSDFFLTAPDFTGCPWNGNLVPGAMTADTGWAANASSGDKSIAVANYAAVNFSALDVGNIGLNALSTQVANITKKLQAIEAALALFLLPNN